MTEHRTAVAARVLASLTAGDIEAADAELDADPHGVAVGMTLACLGMLESIAGGPDNVAATAREWAVSLAAAEILDPSPPPRGDGRHYRDVVRIEEAS